MEIGHEEFITVLNDKINMRSRTMKSSDELNKEKGKKTKNKKKQNYK